MSAPAQSRIDKLGIIAGGGAMPARLLHACDKNGIEPFVVAFEGQTNTDILQGRKYMMTRLGATGLIINTLKAHGIRDLVLIGSIRRPSLKELKPDLKTLTFFAKLSARAVGDDGLLKAVKGELEGEGFLLHGVQRFAQDLLVSEGHISHEKPKAQDSNDIARGIEILECVGVLDIGQAAVVQEGIVLGVEAAEGTDELIRRCGTLKRAGRGPVLVKISKPGQDYDMDLPTIGPETIRLAGESGFSGVVVEAGKTLVIDPEHISELADRFGLFVTAMKVRE